MSGSPFVRRTELVLVEKSIDYELIALSRDDGDLQTLINLVQIELVQAQLRPD